MLGSGRGATALVIALTAHAFSCATKKVESAKVTDLGDAGVRSPPELYQASAPSASPALLPAAPRAPSCTTDAQAGSLVFASPEAPHVGAKLRVVAVSEKPLDAELVVVAPGGAEVLREPSRRGGPPYWWAAEISDPVAGTYRATLAQIACADASHDLVQTIVVARAASRAAIAPAGSALWPVRRAWSRGFENLYSAWIEKLFDAPLDASLSWPALHEGLRDPSRNLLYDHLGAGEDRSTDGALVIRPDCADLPYFLRAYFSFKLGLAFGWSKCSRGGGGAPPSCEGWRNNEIGVEPNADATDAGADAPPRKKPVDAVSVFGAFLRRALADAAHSGSGRVPAASDETDYYPVALTEDTLRPGTIFADPYGHVLVVARRVPQTDKAGGVLLAVDGQPDGTVARKRFWRGNFLFALDPANGSPGFKRFRPIVRDKSGALRRLGNEQIAKSADYGDMSLDQYARGVEGFYDRMDEVLSPSTQDPMRAMTETLSALEEQVNTRVNSVENGRKFLESRRGPATMPDLTELFETTGPWEDFSTPSRDLRLLIAIDVVRGFPDRVARRPERYAMPAGKSVAAVKAELDALLAAELARRKFSYTRSDGSSFTLPLSDVVARSIDLEVAYDPNDCVEVRWGAPAGSEEAKTCQRRAPPAELARMAEYRSWFHERKRPPRK